MGLGAFACGVRGASVVAKAGVGGLLLDRFPIEACNKFVNIYNYIIEGSLEVKLPTIWTDEKQSREEAERRERLEERRSEEKESEERRCRCAKR